MFHEFEIESHHECAYDHVALYDGDSSEDPTLGRFCGLKAPHPIVASSNELYMVFKSDSSVQRRGFQATHATGNYINQTKLTSVTYLKLNGSVFLPVCGGHLQASSGVKHFYSHAKYGDNNYENKEDCDWVIEAPPGKNVHLTFLTFELEDEHECGYDSIEVYQGFDDSGPSNGRYCGNRVMLLNQKTVAVFWFDKFLNWNFLSWNLRFHLRSFRPTRFYLSVSRVTTPSTAKGSRPLTSLLMNLRTRICPNPSKLLDTTEKKEVFIKKLLSRRGKYSRRLVNCNVWIIRYVVSVSFLRNSFYSIHFFSLYCGKECIYLRQKKFELFLLVICRYTFGAQ